MGDKLVILTNNLLNWGILYLNGWIFPKSIPSPVISSRLKWKRIHITWHLRCITYISHKIATLWHRPIISTYGTIIFNWLMMFVYNNVIYIWDEFQNNTLKDILLLYVYILDFSVVYLRILAAIVWWNL